MKIFVSERIHLGQYQPSDLAACLEYLQEKAIYDHTLRIPYPYTQADFHEWLKLVEKATQQQGRCVHWAIRDEGGLLIGGCGFDGFQMGQSHRAEIGYWLAKPYWGGGIMTAVVRRLCEVAFAEFGLVKITAHIFAHNRPSARVLEKCGFRQEGYLRRHYLKDGRYLDARSFALLKE
jgi:RimJ/RimL family protein N-acetyltransferase